jgi:hypothetical protein
MADAPLQLCMNPTPKPLSIPLPFGVELKALLDMSKGPPNDCAMIHSLMIQITPMLAGMECMLRVLKVVMALKGIAAAPPDFGALLSAIEELAECFVMLTPAGLGKLIAAILRLIIKFLNCFLEAIESILKFQVGIDLGSAQGNPILLASLNCAQENSKKSMDGMMQAMGGAQPLMDILTTLGGIVGLKLQLPSISDIAGEPDALVAVENLRNTLVQLEQIADSLPV